MIVFYRPLFRLVSFVAYLLCAHKFITCWKPCSGCWWKPLDHAEQSVVKTDLCCLTNSATRRHTTCDWFSFTLVNFCFHIIINLFMSAPSCLANLSAWELKVSSVGRTWSTWHIYIDACTIQTLVIICLICLIILIKDWIIISKS
jgi:hypothetical protein